MTEKEAKALKHGDKVTTKIGDYIKHGTFIGLESDGRGGIWIHYEWGAPKKKNFGIKRPELVRKGWLYQKEAQKQAKAIQKELEKESLERARRRDEALKAFYAPNPTRWGSGW